MMLLHICDDNIFFEKYFKNFEIAAPGLSTYLINKNNSIKRTYSNGRNVWFIKNLSENIDFILNKNSKYKVIIIHGLTNDKVAIVNRYYKKYKFLWVFWGADGLYLRCFNNIWYSKETKVLLRNNGIKSFDQFSRLKNKLTYNSLYQYLYYLFRGKYQSDYEKIKAIKKMDYIAPVIKEDYDVLLSKIRTKAKYIPFTIGSINVRPSSPSPVKTEVNILLGNSADPSNNHIDVLKILKKYNYSGKVVCPLSYGDYNYKEY